MAKRLAQRSPVYSCTICGTRFVGTDWLVNKAAAEQCAMSGKPEYKFSVGFKFTGILGDIDGFAYLMDELFPNKKTETHKSFDPATAVREWTVKAQVIRSKKVLKTIKHVPYYQVSAGFGLETVSEKQIIEAINRHKASLREKPTIKK